MLGASALQAQTAQPAPAASVSRQAGAAPAASASSLPDRLPYDGGPVPSGYHVDSEPGYRALVVGGAITGIGVATLVVV